MMEVEVEEVHVNVDPVMLRCVVTLPDSRHLPWWLRRPAGLAEILRAENNYNSTNNWYPPPPGKINNSICAWNVVVETFYFETISHPLQ